MNQLIFVISQNNVVANKSWFTETDRRYVLWKRVQKELFIHAICSAYFFSAPGILELASNEKWADEFLTTAKEPMGPDWSGEFLDQKSGHGPPHPAGELRWAEEYLDHTEHRPW